MPNRLFLFILLFLFSCTTPQQIEKSRETHKGREADGSFFYLKPDGQKVVATKITRPSVGNHTSERIIVDGQKMDAPDEVMAFQDANGYYKFLKDPKPTKYWKGQFVQRLRGGKMSLYYRSVSGVGSPADYYYFDKDNGPLLSASYENFSAALSDKPAVLAEFERLYPKKKVMANREQEENRINLPRLVEAYNQ